jgi:hypothetical protein
LMPRHPPAALTSLTKKYVFDKFSNNEQLLIFSP